MRQTEVDVRLRICVERLQRLIESGVLQIDHHDPSGREAAQAVCYPPDRQQPLSRRPLEGRSSEDLEKAWEADQQKPLLPFPGYPNAAIAHAVETCVGLNLLGASDETRNNLLRELQAKLSTTGRYTYVCITDSTDFSYFIQRGITFEYIGYLDRLDDRNWKQYFLLNIALIKKKYGLNELVPAGDPRYVV